MVEFQIDKFIDQRSLPGFTGYKTRTPSVINILKAHASITKDKSYWPIICSVLFSGSYVQADNSNLDADKSNPGAQNLGTSQNNGGSFKTYITFMLIMNS